MYKGYLKILTLKELSEKEASGYDLMERLAEYGKKPSAGSVYPLLNDLEEDGMIKMKESGRKKIYSITYKGKQKIKKLMKAKNELMQKHMRLCESIGGEDDFLKHNQKDIEDAMFRNIDQISELKETFYILIKEDKMNRNQREIRKILSDTIKKLQALR